MYKQLKRWMARGGRPYFEPVIREPRPARPIKQSILVPHGLLTTEPQYGESFLLTWGEFNRMLKYGRTISPDELVVSLTIETEGLTVRVERGVRIIDEKE